jgi:AcrR family transcriptional regulator
MAKLQRSDANAGASGGDGRLDRRAWIEAAYALLVEQGVEGVRVLPLARRLGVTRGSFYWHFKSRRELLEALVDLWRNKNTRAVIDAVRRPARDLPERFLHIARCWLDQSIYDPRLDIAFRDWARRDRRILGLVHKADEARIAAFAELFQANGETARMALVRARIVYYMQMGYYIIGIREPLARRVGFFREYYEAFTGKRLSKRRSRQIETALLAAKPNFPPPSRAGGGRADFKSKTELRGDVGVSETR